MHSVMKTNVKKEVLFARLPPDLISRLNCYVDEIYGTRFARSKVVTDAIEEYLKKENSNTETAKPQSRRVPI